MRTPENFIYHCVTCGRIEQREVATAELFCCGLPMLVTCTEKQSSSTSDTAFTAAGALPPLLEKDRITAPSSQVLKLLEP